MVVCDRKCAVNVFSVAFLQRLVVVLGMTHRWFPQNFGKAKTFQDSTQNKLAADDASPFAFDLLAMLIETYKFMGFIHLLRVRRYKT